MQPPTCTEVRLRTLPVCYCLASRKASSSSCLFPPPMGQLSISLLLGTSSHMVSLGLPRMTENTGSEQWERLNNHLPYSSDSTQAGLRHAKEQHFKQKVSFCQFEIWCIAKFFSCAKHIQHRLRCCEPSLRHNSSASALTRTWTFVPHEVLALFAAITNTSIN